MPGTGEVKGKVDVAVLSAEAGDVDAVADLLPEWAGIARGARQYPLLRAGGALTALARGSQGSRADMARATATLLEELAPAWLVVIGPALAVPGDEPSLGDVLVATTVLDHAAEAVLGDGSRTFAAAPMDEAAFRLASAAGSLDLGEWAPEERQPEIDTSLRPLYGTKRTKAEAQAALRRRAAAGARAPRLATGPLLASDAPLGEAELIRVWQTAPRQFRAVETEAASVHRVAHERGVKVLVVRGVAGVIGARPSAAWEAWARLSAASCAAALVRSGALRRTEGEAPRRPEAPPADAWLRQDTPARDALAEAARLARLGDAALDRGEVEVAAARYGEALPLYRAVGDVRGEASSALRFGEIALRRGDEDEARRQYAAALPLFRRVGDPLGEANCVARLGDLSLRGGDEAEARRRLSEALPLYRRAGDVQGEANCALRLGDMALRRGEAEEAVTRFEEALGLYARVGEPYSMGLTHRKLARVAPNERLRQRHLEAAREHWAKAGRVELVAKIDAELGR